MIQEITEQSLSSKCGVTTKMAWGKAGSTTLTCSGTDLSVTSMTNSKTGMALGLHSSGGTAIKLNGENGTNGSGNYAVRRSVNGGSDSTNTQRNGDNAYITDTRANPHFNVTYFVNVSSEEKLWINNNVHQNSAGAGTSPQREKGAGKWANTSDAISQFDYHCWNGTYASGDNITVLGSDLTPASAVTFPTNVQVGSRAEITDTRKIYYRDDISFKELGTLPVNYRKNSWYEQLTGETP